MVKPWSVLEKGIVQSFKVLDIYVEKAVSPRTNRAHNFVILSSTPWVNIVPITPEGHVVMIRQYRHGIKAVTLEIPGGLVEPGDSPREAALRELREETGYQVQDHLDLGLVQPNPALFDNTCHSFLGLGAHKVGELYQDEKEDIEVTLVPLREVPGLIREGVIAHSLVIVAFYRVFMENRGLVAQYLD